MTPFIAFLSGSSPRRTRGRPLFSAFVARQPHTLFAWFAAAFNLLAIGRTLLGFVQPVEILYALRLVAFLLIIAAIVLKNC